MARPRSRPLAGRRLRRPPDDAPRAVDAAAPSRPGRLPPEEQQRGWWMREALQADRGESCPPLAGDAEADVLILGGGFTGMWTAWFLTEHRPGIDVVLLEQDIAGGGPSGRNGGFLTGWWDELPSMAEMFGERAAIDACLAVKESIAGIRAWCEASGVDAWFTQAGYLEGPRPRPRRAPGDGPSSSAGTSGTVMSTWSCRLAR